MRNRMIIWILLGGGALVLFLVTVAALIVTIGSSDGGGDFAFGDRIQVVNIDGELTDSRFLMDQLTRYEDSESVRGILLNIDSPGGGVATSQELHAQVRRLRCATSTECHEAFECVTTQPMREGPSEPAYRRGLQTTFGGCGQKPWS